MPLFVDGEEFERLRRSDELLIKQNGLVDKLSGQLQEAETALSGLRMAVGINGEVTERIARYRDEVHIGESEIERRVTEELTVEGKAAVTAEITEGLKAERREATKERVLLEEGPSIRKDLSELFETNGTFKKVDDGARAEVRREIAADLRAQRVKEVEEGLEDPDAKAEFMAAIQSEVDADPDVEAHRLEFRRRMERKWRDEAQQLALAEAEHEVLTDKAKIVAGMAASYAESWEGREQVQDRKDRVRQRIESMAVEDLLRDSGNDEHERLLEERRQIEARKLAIKNRAESLALEFTNEGGIDSSKIEENTALEIVLGSSINETVEYTDRNGYRRDKEAPVLIVNRRIKLTSMGGGMFRVDRDTLVHSSNSYAARNGLEEGKVIAIGIVAKKPGENGEDTKVLMRKIKAGATFQYDTDTSTPEFTDGGLPIANVVIGGVSAREIEHHRDQLL